METTYKVKLYMDETYEVIEITPIDETITNMWIGEGGYPFNEKSVYQGRLADCEAWIRLTEGGYM